jgi:hypothetical protein
VRHRNRRRRHPATGFLPDIALEGVFLPIEIDTSARLPVKSMTTIS